MTINMFIAENEGRLNEPTFQSLIEWKNFSSEQIEKKFQSIS